MTTRANMIAEIQDDTLRLSASEAAAISLKIDAAIRQYQNKRFDFNESRSVVFNTVIGTDIYAFNTATTVGAIGAEFYKIDGIWLTRDGSDVGWIDRVDYTEVEAWADTQIAEEGTPYVYAYIDRALRFYRNPDQVYPIRVAGHLKIAVPDTEDDNPWMNEAYQLIMSRAKAELYAHRWEDPNNASLMRAAEMDALRSLLGETDDKVSPGYLTASDF